MGHFHKESQTCCFFRAVIVMFMGEYNHTIDAKGRLIIPSKFRESLGEEFVITKGLDGCLFVYDNQEWNAFEEKLKALPLSRKDNRQFARFFLAGAAQVEVTVRTGTMQMTVEEMLLRLSRQPNVVEVHRGG